LIVGALATTLVACGSLTTHYVLTGRPQAAYTGDVQIVLEGATAPPNLYEVAIVQAVGGGTKANLEDLVDGLKEQARQLGCDIVVRVHVDQGDSVASASGVAAKVGSALAAPPPPKPDSPLAIPGDAGPATEIR
jgi:hypothetical protein